MYLFSYFLLLASSIFFQQDSEVDIEVNGVSSFVI